MMQYYGQHLLQTVIKDTEYADRAMRVSLKFGTKTRQNPDFWVHFSGLKENLDLEGLNFATVNHDVTKIGIYDLLVADKWLLRCNKAGLAYVALCVEY